VSWRSYPMSMSLHNHSDLEHIEIDLTPEQTEVLVQAAARRQGTSALEPLPIEAPTDPLPLSLHQAMSPEGEALPSFAPNAKWPEGELLWLSESEVTPLERESLSLPIQETIALESDAAPIPTSQQKSIGSNEQSRKPLRTGRVGLLVRVLLYVGLVVGIVYVRQIGEEPIRVAQKVDPKATRVGEERAATVPSDSEAMLIKNPFDRTEAFEFPPGTSKAEAREAVAKLLMERAHDRLPLLAEASHRRGATTKHGTRESSQPQDSQYRNSQAVLGRGPG
jgi:hypothetical protein